MGLPEVDVPIAGRIAQVVEGLLHLPIAAGLAIGAGGTIEEPEEHRRDQDAGDARGGD